MLDTAAWIWLVSDPGSLSKRAKAAVDDHEERFVSSISAWEVGMLVSKSRLMLDRPLEHWIDHAMRVSGMSPVPVDHQIGILATCLPASPPTGPADRIIIATSLRLGALLITPDRAILDYPFCPTLW